MNLSQEKSLMPDELGREGLVPKKRKVQVFPFWHSKVLISRITFDQVRKQL